MRRSRRLRLKRVFQRARRHAKRVNRIMKGRF